MTKKISSKWTRHIMVLFLFLFMGINFADKAVLGLVAVPLMQELNINSTQFGAIAGSFFFLFAISGIAFGFISNTVSSKPLLAILVVIWSIAQLPIAFGASSVAFLMACRVLLGVGEGPAYPLALHSCYKWFSDKERNIPTAIIMQGGQVGMLVAGPIVGYLTFYYGWRSTFLFMAVVGVIWLVFWLLFGKDGDEVKKQSQKPEEITLTSVDPIGKQELQLSYKKLFLERTFVGNLLLYWVAYWVTSLVFTWLPAYLQKGLGYTITETGWLFSLCIFMAIPIVTGASVLSNHLLKKGFSSRQARVYLAAFGTLLGAVCIVGAFFFEFNRFFKMLLLAAGCSFPQICFVLCAAVSAEISPANKRGASLAVTNSLATTAGLIAPMVMGYFVQNVINNHGFYYGFMLTAGVLSCGALLALILVNPGRTMESQKSKFVTIGS